ncbi:hypothetical protein CALVIDRAFT_379501 [Calocera viscosa TUFC12733]|uniref:Uncharacterized protein n=1 Tax=Calocera viscosa (strain TUFC12733) TaxID=1330018 RepID=A0A167Q3U7_CALVF|nr:hypothetical protein CALVIDRAFT_379501 [Calocera viscosa TUFC12733]
MTAGSRSERGTFDVRSNAPARSGGMRRPIYEDMALQEGKRTYIEPNEIKSFCTLPSNSCSVSASTPRSTQHHTTMATYPRTTEDSTTAGGSQVNVERFGNPNRLPTNPTAGGPGALYLVWFESDPVFGTGVTNTEHWGVLAGPPFALPRKKGLFGNTTFFKDTRINQRGYQLFHWTGDTPQEFEATTIEFPELPFIIGKIMICQYTASPSLDERIAQTLSQVPQPNVEQTPTDDRSLPWCFDALQVLRRKGFMIRTDERLVKQIGKFKARVGKAGLTREEIGVMLDS